MWDSSTRSTAGSLRPRIGCVDCAAREAGVSRSSQCIDRKPGLRTQGDALARRERGDREGPGADGTLSVAVAFCLDDLPRHPRRGRDGEQERKGRVRRVEPDAQRVAIDEHKAGDRRVVVDGTPRILGALRQRVEPFDLAFEQVKLGDRIAGSSTRRIEYAKSAATSSRGLPPKPGCGVKKMPGRTRTVNVR